MIELKNGEYTADSLGSLLGYHPNTITALANSGGLEEWLNKRLIGDYSVQHEVRKVKHFQKRFFQIVNKLQNDGVDIMANKTDAEKLKDIFELVKDGMSPDDAMAKVKEEQIEIESEDTISQLIPLHIKQFAINIGASKATELANVSPDEEYLAADKVFIKYKVKQTLVARLTKKYSSADGITVKNGKEIRDWRFSSKSKDTAMPWFVRQVFLDAVHKHPKEISDQFRFVDSGIFGDKENPGLEGELIAKDVSKANEANKNLQKVALTAVAAGL